MHMRDDFDLILTIFVIILDVNECALRTHNCHTNATCTNTDGSFSCTCDHRYTGNGVTCTGKQKYTVVFVF